MTLIDSLEKYIDDLSWVMYYLENPQNTVEEREKKLADVKELIAFFKAELKQEKRRLLTCTLSKK